MSNTFSCARVLSGDVAWVYTAIEAKHQMFTFPHWSAPAELTRPTKVPSSVVKAPPLSPCRVLMELGNFLIGDHFSQYKWVIYTKTSVFVLSFWQITSFVATRAEMIKAITLKIPDKCPFHCRQHKRYLRRKQVRSPPHSFCKHSLWLLAPGVEVHWVNLVNKKKKP